MIDTGTICFIEPEPDRTLEPTMQLRVVHFKRYFASGDSGDAIDSWRKSWRLEQLWFDRITGAHEWQAVEEVNE